MIKFKVKMDIDAARRSLRGLEKEVNKGAARALERVATTVRKEADQAIRERINLRFGAVKKALRIIRPYGPQRLIRDIKADGKPIALLEFGARQTQRRGVTYAVVKGQRKTFVSKQGRKGFISPKLGGHVFVATAKNPPGPKNAPIRKVFGPSIPQSFMTKRLRDRMRRTAAQRWPIEFVREMRFRRSRAGR